MVLPLHTFLFADMCDYTEDTWLYGDDWSAEVAIGFHELCRSVVAEEGGEYVKSIGDGAMIRAVDCDQALRVARRIRALNAQRGYPELRIGIDTGPAVPRDGDWWGTTVNRASRVTKEAAPGELLLTERARAAALGCDELQIVDRGERMLKGLPDCALHAALEVDLDVDVEAHMCALAA
jgi:adenylate cyclase